MPEMDGYRVLEAMQALPSPMKDIPVIFISSFSAIESMAEYGGAPITISRTGGLYLAESIRYLRAVLGEVEAYVEEPARL
jgi:CheY-like chemotaxis protein